MSKQQDDETTTGAKPKREISPARLAANRENAKRSTGPRTPEGKAVSKLNGLVHGMRAQSEVLPGEDPEELRRRHETWADELGAATEPERCLVRAAVDASWRIDRCRAAEAAALTRRVLEAGDAYDDDLAEEVERLVERLEEEPASVVRQLRRSSAGCRWLIGRWGALAERLDGWKALEPTERHLAANLMGKRHDDLFDPAVSRLTVAYLGALRIDAERACQYLRDDRPEGMSEVEFDRRIVALCAALPGSAEGHAAQVAIVAGAIDELAERLELVEAGEACDRELAVRAASFDASPAGASRLRYEMSHERVLRASLRDLRALQKERPEPGVAASSACDGDDASSLPDATTHAPTEPKAEAVAPTEAIATGDKAPTEATGEAGTVRLAPTEAKAEADPPGNPRPTIVGAPTEAKAEAEGVGSALAPTEPNHDPARLALAPIEPNRDPARPAAATVGEEGGTTRVAEVDPVWVAPTTRGLEELMVGAT